MFTDTVMDKCDHLSRWLIVVQFRNPLGLNIKIGVKNTQDQKIFRNFISFTQKHFSKKRQTFDAEVYWKAVSFS